MRSKESIQELVQSFETASADEELVIDEEGLFAAYQKTNDAQSLAIKILSVFGGLLASTAFLGFLFIAGLYNSDTGLLAFGAVCIAGAIWINKAHDKIIIDTLSISFFIIGFILLGLGLSELKADASLACIIFIAIGLCSLSICQNYILSFVSVLIINGSILTIIISNYSYDLTHLYVSALALIITYVSLNEGRIITSNIALSRLYDPIRTGLIFSFFAGLIILGKRGILPVTPQYIWLSSIVIIAAIIYLLASLFQILDITSLPHKAIIYILSILLLAPTAPSPAISGAILIILLSFLVNHKTGFALGIIGAIYFISQFYYDLNFTLLAKSILLFSSGVVLIVLYLLTRKTLTSDEKI